MSEESRENAGGVIAGMLRSLEDRHLDIVPSAELEKAEPAVSPANSSSDEVLEMAGDFNYDGYQVVRREFFAHINEPSVTFNNYKFYVNTACLNRFPQVDYVQVLVNQESRILAIRPCRAEDRDACAWCTNCLLYTSLRPSRSHIGASLRKSKSQAGRRGFGVR